mgnify:CR=1 FL=1
MLPLTLTLSLREREQSVHTFFLGIPQLAARRFLRGHNTLAVSLKLNEKKGMAVAF